MTADLTGWGPSERFGFVEFQPLGLSESSLRPSYKYVSDTLSHEHPNHGGVTFLFTLSHKSLFSAYSLSPL